MAFPLVSADGLWSRVYPVMDRHAILQMPYAPWRSMLLIQFRCTSACKPLCWWMT